MGCFSPLILELDWGGVQVYSFLVWKNRFVLGKITQDCLFQFLNKILYHHNQLSFKEHMRFSGSIQN